MVSYLQDNGNTDSLHQSGINTAVFIHTFGLQYKSMNIQGNDNQVVVEWCDGITTAMAAALVQLHFIPPCSHTKVSQLHHTAVLDLIY